MYKKPQREFITVRNAFDEVRPGCIHISPPEQLPIICYVSETKYKTELQFKTLIHHPPDGPQYIKSLS